MEKVDNSVNLNKTRLNYFNCNEKSDWMGDWKQIKQTVLHY